MNKAEIQLEMKKNYHVHLRKYNCDSSKGQMKKKFKHSMETYIPLAELPVGLRSSLM